MWHPSKLRPDRICGGCRHHVHCSYLTMRTFRMLSAQPILDRLDVEQHPRTYPVATSPTMIPKRLAVHTQRKALQSLVSSLLPPFIKPTSWDTVPSVVRKTRRTGRSPLGAVARSSAIPSSTSVYDIASNDVYCSDADTVDLSTSDICSHAMWPDTSHTLDSTSLESDAPDCSATFDVDDSLPIIDLVAENDPVPILVTKEEETTLEVPTDEGKSQQDHHEHPIVSRLAGALRQQNQQLALDTFYEILTLNQRKRHDYIEIPPVIVHGLFRLMGKKRPFDLYRILKYYTTLKTSPEYLEGDGSINGYARMYNRLCDSLRHLDPRQYSHDDCQSMVRSVLSTIRNLDFAGREMCYPTFVSAMLAQKYCALGMFTRIVYQQILEENMTVPDGFWIHLLSHSRYNRQNDLPFADVLSRIVDTGRRPHPDLVLNALDNFFPFTDIETMTKAMKAILRLQQLVLEAAKCRNDANNTDPTANGAQYIDNERLRKEQYYVDIGTLEMIGAAAASQGHSDMNLLVWDMLDVLGYEPTEAIYENTVTAFAANTFTYKEAFTVLSEMESRGFQPSRALIRSFSLHIREHASKIDFALEQLRLLRHEGKPPTTAALNVIMSGSAETGDIDRILSLYQEYSRNNLEVNADTFSFCFESLGKNLIRDRNPGTQDHLNACLIAAESFLTLMEERNIAPTHHVIRNYVELLCLAGQVEVATAIVLEAAAEKGFVCSKTLYRVAMANAKIRQFEAAYKVAQCVTGEPMAFLKESIAREERQIWTANEAARAAERNQFVGNATEEASVEHVLLESNNSTAGTFWSIKTNATDNIPTGAGADDVICSVAEEKFQRRRDLDDAN